ncbi:MAG: hypothetical protein AABY11_01725 [archaeon]
MSSESIALAIQLKELAYPAVILGAILLFGLVAYAIRTKPRKEKVKSFLFWSIATVAVGVTLFLAGSTVFINTVSPTGGPVHWHTDYEVWYCGEQLDLVDPLGIDNRVGTWEVHEHNDNRMHIEGTIVDVEQGTFKHFFEVIGGSFTRDTYTFPSTKGNITIPTSGNCNGEPAVLQGFLHRVDNPEKAKEWTYSQRKISFPWSVEMAPYSNVPPGDCLVIVFGPEQEKIDRVCASYRAAQNRGELNGR